MLCHFSSCPSVDDATLRVVEDAEDMGTSARNTKLVRTHFCVPPLYQVEWLDGEELRDRVTRLTCRSFFQNDYGLDRGINSIQWRGTRDLVNRFQATDWRDLTQAFEAELEMNM